MGTKKQTQIHDPVVDGYRIAACIQVLIQALIAAGMNRFFTRFFRGVLVLVFLHGQLVFAVPGIMMLVEPGCDQRVDVTTIELHDGHHQARSDASKNATMISAESTLRMMIAIRSATIPAKAMVVAAVAMLVDTVQPLFSALHKR